MVPSTNAWAGLVALPVPAGGQQLERLLAGAPGLAWLGVCVAGSNGLALHAAGAAATETTSGFGIANAQGKAEDQGRGQQGKVFHRRVSVIGILKRA